MRQTILKTCSSCNGSGAKDGITRHTMGTDDLYNRPDWACPVCGGWGMVSNGLEDEQPFEQNNYELPRM